MPRLFPPFSLLYPLRIHFDRNPWPHFLVYMWTRAVPALRWHHWAAETKRGRFLTRQHGLHTPHLRDAGPTPSLPALAPLPPPPPPQGPTVDARSSPLRQFQVPCGSENSSSVPKVRPASTNPLQPAALIPGSGPHHDADGHGGRQEKDDDRRRPSSSEAK